MDVASAPSPGERGQASGLIAIGSSLLAFVAFAILRAGAGGHSLADLERQSTSLDHALANGKPTLVEFYADWCDVCRELAAEEFDLVQQYNGKVNFVMLNVENTKWAAEVSEYGVAGVPHFLFLDESGHKLAAGVGRVPSKTLQANIAALSQHAPLPFANARGKTSALPAEGAAPLRQAQPRDHA